MFAPRVATTQTKGDASSTGRFGQRTSRQAGNERDGDREREIVRENLTDLAAPSRLAWDFAKIPLFPPDRTSRSQASYPLPGTIQPKLAVGAVNDPLEHEADRVADQVMRISEATSPLATAAPRISRKCAECEEEERIQAKRVANNREEEDTPDIAADALASAGHALDAASRAFFEPRFRHDFSTVRIHTDDRAKSAAKAIQAHAYTLGRDIAFAEGQYAPGTPMAAGFSPTS